MTAERNKFKFTTTRASIHGTTIRRIPTIYDLLNIFHDNRTRMENVLYFFIMFSENLFKYVQLHETTIKEKEEKGSTKFPS